MDRSTDLLIRRQKSAHYYYVQPANVALNLGTAYIFALEHTHQVVFVYVFQRVAGMHVGAAQ